LGAKPSPWSNTIPGLQLKTKPTKFQKKKMSKPTCKE
jgi:hypothetical protein